MWSYHNEPIGGYSVRIQEIVTLRPSVSIASKRTRSGKVVSSTSLATDNPIFNSGRSLHLDFSDVWDASMTTATGERADQLLQRWGLAGHELDCYWLPAPILTLALSGRWSTLIVAASWQTSLTTMLAWPSAEWLENFSAAGARQRHGPRGQPPCVQLTSHLAQNLKGSLRQWAPMILDQTADEEERIEETFKLRKYVHLCNSVGSSAGNTTLGFIPEEKRERHGWLAA